MREALANWGPLLLEAADIIESLRPADARANEPTNKEIDHAVRGARRSSRLACCKLMNRPTPLRSSGLPRHMRQRLRTKAALMKQRSVRSNRSTGVPSLPKRDSRRGPRRARLPRAQRSALGDRCGELDESLFDECIAVVLGLAMRAFLDKYARQCARLADMRDSPVVDYERRLTCPSAARADSRPRCAHGPNRQRQAALLRRLRRNLEIRAHPLRRLRRRGRLGPQVRA